MSAQISSALKDWSTVQDAIRKHKVRTYLLILWGGGGDVVHQDGHELGNSVDAGSKSTIWGIAIDRMVLLFGLFQPFSGYGVYYVEHAQFVRAGSLFEMCEDLLNEERFGLPDEIQSVCRP